MPEVCKMSFPGKSKLKKVSLTAGRIVGLLVGIVLTGYYANSFLYGWWRDKRPEWYIGIEDIVFYGIFALSAILWLGGAYWRCRAKKRIRSPAASGFRRPVSLPVRTLTSILKVSGVILGSALFFPVSCTTALLAGIEINSHHFGRDMLRGDKPRPPFYVVATISKEDIRPIELIEVDAYIGRTPDVSFLIAQRSGALSGDSPDERFSWRVISSNPNEQLVEVRYYDGDTTFMNRYRSMQHSVSPVSQRKWYHGYMFASFPFAIGFGLLVYGLGSYLRRKYVVTISERTNMRKWLTPLVIICILGIVAANIWSYVAYRKNLIRQEQAISDFNKALEINPGDAEAYLRRGNAQAEKGRYKQAISDYTKALQINPKDAMVYVIRATAYYFQREYDKSWKDVEKAEYLGHRIDPEFLDDLRKASGRKN
jgi:hypothetical protein